MSNPTSPSPPFLRSLCLFAAVAFAAIASSLSASFAAEPPVSAELLDVKMIWNHAPHNAFTDLVRWQGKWYCGFREGAGHVGDRGKLRVIVSPDGDQWEPAALLEMDDYDLRDAALSVTPDDRLMVLGGAQNVVDDQRTTGTFVSFSSDGNEFTTPELVPPHGRWLWRITWHDDTAYGVSYATPMGHPFTSLLASRDGRHYETIVPELLGQGWPTEARLRFAADGTAYCLQRRDGEPPANSAYLGISTPPYTAWEWHDLGIFLGGPNFIETPEGHWIAAGRILRDRPTTDLAYLDVQTKTLTPFLTLPSGGDTSYPGLVWHDGVLWISYYSSHQGKANIYLAKVKLTTNDKAQ